MPQEGRDAMASGSSKDSYGIAPASRADVDHRSGERYLSQKMQGSGSARRHKNTCRFATAAFSILATISASNSSHAQSLGFSFTGVFAKNTNEYGYSTIDNLGLFGPAGADLTGQAFTVTISYVPSYFEEDQNDSPPTYYYNMPGIAGSMTQTITVNNSTFTVASNSGYVDTFIQSITSLGLYYETTNRSNPQDPNSPSTSLEINFVPSAPLSFVPSTPSLPAAPQPDSAVTFAVYNSDGTSESLSGVSSGPPLLSFNGTLVSQLTQPIPVVVGQQISMTALNISSEAAPQPWAVTGPAPVVAGYTYPASAPCSGASCAPGTLIPMSPAMFSNPQATTFYFYVPGTYTVTYSYPQGDGTTTSVPATFVVEGPVVKPGDVFTTPPYPVSEPVNLGEYQKTWEIVFGVHGHDGQKAVQGMTFEQMVAPPATAKGYFFWVQLTEDSTFWKKLHGDKGEAVEGSYYLDNVFPSSDNPQDHPNCYARKIWDSPLSPLSEYSEFARDFYAKTYLMWSMAPIGGSPGAIIPVPLGSVSWQFSADVYKVAGFWFGPSLSRTQAGVGGATSLFNSVTGNPVVDFPQWTGVNVTGDLLPACQ